MATRVQLETAAAAGCLTRVYEVSHWFYGRIETADSQLYFQCGFMKVVPLEVRSVVPHFLHGCPRWELPHSLGLRGAGGGRLLAYPAGRTFQAEPTQ